MTAVSLANGRRGPCRNSFFGIVIGLALAIVVVLLLLLLLLLVCTIEPGMVG